MMHGRGESDAAIVAAKPTNKAERFAAEQGRRPREMRASKARAGHRAGGTVSQALERIRHDASISRRAVTHPRWEP